MDYREFYYSKLPHIQPLGGTFFITTRLAGSIPQVEKVKLVEEYELRKRQLKATTDNPEFELDKLERIFFAKYEAIVDKAEMGPMWLRDEKIAKVVAGAFHFWDTKKYDLMAYSIMSNHIHLVFTLNETNDKNPVIILDRVMQSLKGFTAIECNKQLKRSGAFWEHGSFDRMPRDRYELHRIVQYTLQNPVKAGLCKDWQDWKWTYIKPEYNDFE
jgi:putative transposase